MRILIRHAVLFTTVLFSLRPLYLIGVSQVRIKDQHIINTRLQERFDYILRNPLSTMKKFEKTCVFVYGINKHA